MVVIFVIITFAAFILVDYLLRKEDKTIQETEKSKKSPIFLSPEKALLPLNNIEKRLYHPSHTWALLNNTDNFYIGYDQFIPFLLSSDIKIHDIYPVGTKIHQGEKIWDIRSNGHSISQLSPISGEITEINPACDLGIPLPSSTVEKSWIVQIRANAIKNEENNLLNHFQADSTIKLLKDDVYSMASNLNYMADGGKIDPSFINKMGKDEWHEFIQRFFPYLTKQRD